MTRPISQWPFPVRPDPLDVAREKLLDSMPPPITESYWLRGFNDGFAGNRPLPPTSNGPHAMENRGYHNGYRVGAEKRRSQA